MLISGKERTSPGSKPKFSASIRVSHGEGSMTGTILDPSFGQDPSVGHLHFLALPWLDYYQIKYMMSSTTA
jgi:hypothetical protein